MADYAEGHINPRDGYKESRREPARSADMADSKFQKPYSFARNRMLADLPVITEQVFVWSLSPFVSLNSSLLTHTFLSVGALLVRACSCPRVKQ